MAAFVKSVDNNHLLEVGLEGFYGQASQEREHFNPGFQVGADFIWNNNILNIDFATVHSYPDQWYHNLPVHLLHLHSLFRYLGKISVLGFPIFLVSIIFYLCHTQAIYFNWWIPEYVFGKLARLSYSRRSKYTEKTRTFHRVWKISEGSWLQHPTKKCAMQYYLWQDLLLSSKRRCGCWWLVLAVLYQRNGQLERRVWGCLQWESLNRKSDCSTITEDVILAKLK